MTRKSIGRGLGMGEGAKVALVGANGVGKTTLLCIVTGELTPQGGSVWGETRVARAR